MFLLHTKRNNFFKILKKNDIIVGTKSATVLLVCQSGENVLFRGIVLYGCFKYKHNTSTSGTCQAELYRCSFTVKQHTSSHVTELSISVYLIMVRSALYCRTYGHFELNCFFSFCAFLRMFQIINVKLNLNDDYFLVCLKKTN